MEVQDKITQSDSVQAEKLPPRHKNSRKRSIIIFTVVSLLNVGLLVLLWSQLLTPAPNANNNNSDGLQLLKGHPAPEFVLAALTAQHAQTLHLSDFKGKPVVLNFWASTCVPCQVEAPMLQTQAQHAQAKGIFFIV